MKTLKIIFRAKCTEIVRPAIYNEFSFLKDKNKPYGCCSLVTVMMSRNAVSRN